MIFEEEGDPTFSWEGVQLLIPMENYMYRSREFPGWSAPLAPPPPPHMDSRLALSIRSMSLSLALFIILDYLKQ